MSSQVTVVKVSGLFDSINGNRIRREVMDLLDSGHINILIDCQDVELMDSSGLGVLVMIYKKVREVNGCMGLCAAPPQVVMLLELTKMNNVFPVFPDQDAFQNHLKSAKKPT